ncbi:hypothetical protein B0H16DRAFT_327437 [Mycena metata]|uniref:Uncharacterized protein n=1 Tax=Mycena metata TaxID=1033252 RepID=A0AAD7HMZ2_9AGAR|nr:hypothetical protein B0H16DRAFT_327437 [Mycena metata]
MIQNIYAFKIRLMHAMLAWLDTLSADVTAQVVFGVELGSSDEEIVAMRLTQALILSMRNKLIELKVWFEITDRWAAYVKDLEERHSKSHFCTYRRSPTLPVHFRPQPFWRHLVRNGYHMGSIVVPSKWISSVFLPKQRSVENFSVLRLWSHTWSNSTTISDLNSRPLCLARLSPI